MIDLLKPALVAVALGLAAAASAAATPPLDPSAFAGAWVSEPWAEALVSSRSPLRAADASPPLAFEVERAPFGWRLTVTSFHEASHWAFVAAQAGARAGEVTLVLDPAEDDQPDLSGRKRVAATLAPAGGPPQGLRAALWSEDEAASFRRLDGPLAAWVNRSLIAGQYRDAQGRIWSFGIDGKARWPERAFDYEVSVDPSEAGCDYLQSPDPQETGGQWRTGFAWHDGRLELFRIVYDQEVPISCVGKPFALLTPTNAAATAPMPAPSRASAAEVGVCGLRRLPIEPRDPGSRAWYVSPGRTLRLEHWSFNEVQDPDRFTDGPIRVIHADGRHCEIDSDNYTAELRLSADEHTLVVVEFSGSNEWVRLYDTASCRRRSELPVGEQLVFDGDTLRDAGSCEMRDARVGTCRPASVRRFDATCVPVRSASESDEATRRRFGIAFSEASEIEFPSTGHARRLGPARW
ncbi:MAG: hypothetical protein IPJ17_10020 [Holophagales bacterium]|nr:MAG: hypothetical protein IPJ17_10020 [Holophagales bacterium]